MRAIVLALGLAALSLSAWGLAAPPNPDLEAWERATYKPTPEYPDFDSYKRSRFVPGPGAVVAPPVGTIVHYYPIDTPANTSHWLRRTPPQPHAAIVADVRGARLVNLAIFQIDGRMQTRSTITFRCPGEPAPKGEDWCELPPK